MFTFIFFDKKFMDISGRGKFDKIGAIFKYFFMNPRNIQQNLDKIDTFFK